MYPMTSDDGVTFIVDDWKAPLWIMQSAFDFLQAAEAGRKFIAIGTISDYGGTTASVYSRVARAALDVADHVLFVGPMATHALRAKTPATAERLHAFATVKDAANFLHPLLRRGDLVLVKGTINADHLGRLVHHWLEPISCRSEEHTSELQSLMRTSYAVFCLKKKHLQEKIISIRLRLTKTDTKQSH